MEIGVTKCPDHKNKVTVKLSDSKGDVLLFYGTMPIKNFTEVV